MHLLFISRLWRFLCRAPTLLKTSSLHNMITTSHLDAFCLYAEFFFKIKIILFISGGKAASQTSQKHRALCTVYNLFLVKLLFSLFDNVLAIPFFSLGWQRLLVWFPFLLCILSLYPIFKYFLMASSCL